MTTNEGKQKEPSAASDLDEQREEFLELFFQKGALFAADMLSELQSLRDQVARLDEDNLQLRHQLASDEAIRELLVKIEELKGDKDRLSSQMQSYTADDRDFDVRHAEMEQELDAMANLYIAGYQLSSATEPQEVLGVIEQLLAQMVGAASFAIYLRRRRGDGLLLEPIYAYRCGRDLLKDIPWGTGPVGEVAELQIHRVIDPQFRAPGDPLAGIPLVRGEDTVGVIAIFELFEQKTQFVKIDFELFKLLALQAAAAIVGTGLLQGAGSIDSSLGAYQRL